VCEVVVAMCNAAGLGAGKAFDLMEG
jgi:hypothetical protein